LAAGLVFSGFKIKAQSMAHRLQEKANPAQAGIRAWVQQGRDPSAVLPIMQQVKPALDTGDPLKAEALLDRALKMLSDRPQPGDKSPPPVSAGKEPGVAWAAFGSNSLPCRCGLIFSVSAT
jgi:hypothetical protein